MQYNIIAIALIALGFALLFFIDYLVKEDNQNSALKYLRDNNMIVGFVCIGAGYYVYTLAEHQEHVAPTIEMSETRELPTYEEATTSTGEILNM